MQPGEWGRGQGGGGAGEGHGSAGAARGGGQAERGQGWLGVFHSTTPNDVSFSATLHHSVPLLCKWLSASGCMRPVYVSVRGLCSVRHAAVW